MSKGGLGLALVKTLVELASPAAIGSGRRVLIIEDNNDAAELPRDLLELDGHTIALAASIASHPSFAPVAPESLWHMHISIAG